MLIGVDASRSFETKPTGTERYAQEILRAMLALPEANKHHWVLFTRSIEQMPSWVKGENRSVCVLRRRWLWTQLGLALTSWRRFDRGRRRGELEVLWVPAHTLPVLRRPGLKTAVTIHGLEYRFLPAYQNWWQRWYLPLSTRYAASQADLLLAVSKFTKKQLIEEFGTSSKKIKVVYEGVAARDSKWRAKVWKKLVARWQLVRGKYFLFVGTIQPRKNLPALIEAWSLARASLPGYKLVLAGANGWQAEESLAAVERFGVEATVVWTGRVSEEQLRALYQGANGYVQPSLTEGFGLPPLEAMRWGVPVLTSTGGALPEVVGRAGLKVRLGPGFARRLARAMVQVSRHQDVRRRLVRAGYKRVNELGWAKAARETLKELEKLAN